MAEFDRREFNRQEFGSTHVTPGAGLVATGRATAAVAPVRRRVTAAISAGCVSTTSVLVTRIHRAVLTLAGALHAAIEPHRRKPVAIVAHGAASAAIAIVRRRISHSSLTGRLLASAGHAVTFCRGAASAGIAHASIRLVRIALPAPVTTGLRVGPWTRPAANSNLRFTGWTAPV